MINENSNLVHANTLDIRTIQKNHLQSNIIEKMQKIYNNYYKSKWSNLKLYIQDKTSLKSSIKLLKKKTIEQFSSKCIEIYRKKLEIQLIAKKNREMFTSLKFNYYHRQNSFISLGQEANINNDEIISKLRVNDLQESIELQIIRDFFFAFREDNTLMMRLIECLDNNQFEIIVPFLCHFFYENFYIENNEQEEILYIIYLLLEKEIDSLYTPSISTFLDKSFVSMLLSEMGNRYEIKQYIDIILNYLIRNIEEINISFYSLDIEENQKDKILIDEKKEILNLYLKDGKNKPNIKKNAKNNDSSSISPSKKRKTNFFLANSTFSALKIENVLARKNLYDEDKLKTFQNKNLSEICMKDILKKELYDITCFKIDEKYLRSKFEAETNDIMRHFYTRLLRQINSASNPNLYNTAQYFVNLLEKNKNISKETLEDFNKGYFLVTKFISELLTNLENNKIMPYSIKVISKFIFTLLTKKFKNISKIQSFLLVNRFLFDKLLLPVIQNPDINDTGKNMIITLNTRKNLYYVYQVLKKLIRGELFEEPNYGYMSVFNWYIINNFERLNKLVENLLEVKAPKKLMDLSEEFYKNENFNLEEIIRDEQSVNYDYFKENPHDFMQHKSICFSKKELNLFFKIVDNNKERFIQGENLGKILEKLSSLMPSIIFKPYDYYVIISDKYNNEVNELLYLDEKKICLGKAKNKNDIFINLKYCISYLISNLDNIFPNWAWVVENLDTIKTFEYINSYLNSYYENKNKFEIGKVPLNWYSTYIMKHLKYLEIQYILNDFQLLYDSLINEIFIQIKKSSNLNKFLTINMTTKNLLINNKIKIYDKELDNVKSTELNIKTAQFIESAQINVCLTNYLELKDIIEYLNSPLDSISQNHPYKLIISKEKNCIHREKMEKKTFKIVKDSLILKKIHSSCINEFAQHLSDYYYCIGQDILDSYKNEQGNENTDENLISKKTMVKEILDTYKEYVIETMNESHLFNLQEFNKNLDENESILRFMDECDDFQEEEKQKKLIQKYEEEKNKSLNIISNYILKRLSIKIYEAELENEDKEFEDTCIKLKWINHNNLEIPNEVFSKNLFNKVIEYVKKMDYLRTPYGMLYEFGLAVQSINSMFIFMLNQKQAEAGDLLPLIIYSIIMAKPKRIIFNIKFIKFFMKQNELLGNVGYNLIQCESSIRYIKSFNKTQKFMDKQEFEDRCKLSLLGHKLNKNKKEELKNRKNKEIKV